MPSELPEPTEYLKSMLGIPEYNEMNSILTEAIHEIETLRKDALDTPTERERRYMEALNRRDEARTESFAKWLADRHPDTRDKIAVSRIYSQIMATVTGYLSNYASVTDGHGKVTTVEDVNERLMEVVHRDFVRITKIDPEAEHVER